MVVSLKIDNLGRISFIHLQGIRVPIGRVTPMGSFIIKSLVDNRQHFIGNKNL